MNDNPIRLGFGCELIEIRIKILDHLRADGVCSLPAFLPIREGFKRVDASRHAPLGVEV